MIRGASRQWAIFDTACAKLQPISDRNPVKRGQRLRSMVSATRRVNVEPFSYWFQPNAWRPFIKVTHDHRVIRRTKPIRYGSQLLATMIPGQPQMGANNHQRVNCVKLNADRPARLEPRQVNAFRIRRPHALPDQNRITVPAKTDFVRRKIRHLKIGLALDQPAAKCRGSIPESSICFLQCDDVGTQMIDDS